MPGRNGASEGVVLTSGHNFEPGEGADNYLYRSSGGTVRRGVRLDTNPFYNRSNEERSGFDAAIVRLDGPVTDAGPPPALYAGRDELDKQIVMVGHGMRGIGSVGESDLYNSPTGRAAAATNVIDALLDAIVPPPRGSDGGNWLQVTLRRESEGAGRLDGMVVLPDGRLLSGTALGTQIATAADAPATGSSLIVIPSPDGRPRCNYVRISPDGVWLYTAYAADILRRRLRPDF